MRTPSILATIAFLFVACNKEQSNTSDTSNLEIRTATNIPAPQTGGMGQPVGGPFTKFSFEKGTVVDDDHWDIAFRGLTIIVNGGARIGINDEPDRTGVAAVSMVNGLLEEVKQAPAESTFRQDGPGTYAIPTGSGQGWYNYDINTHLVFPIPGRIFVVRTHNGRYAKFEILSYYKDAPARPTQESQSRFYTFRYVYQPDGSGKF
ncbi:hypothetical protein JCM31826_12700 [Thermaurantimonas aggregans]|uniref:HmuY protein n=1 Tax=Thermaurantimonas aggregans TaxID=2173829 RepID=A0A401XLB9_9FLAO|nr:HmuY family protein [Thermaurantimonas aggregans]MCX8148282.1 HmuY family protein [Thermaurantimonas aggregans]GCD77788.1 hypothetical protein JCM31826_12700 [Thermaurantimonas aggregans]